jgi:hypothetical protein
MTKSSKTIVRSWKNPIKLAKRRIIPVRLITKGLRFPTLSLSAPKIGIHIATAICIIKATTPKRKLTLP